MKKDMFALPSLTALMLASGALTGCRAIEGIFKAGVWVGVIAVVFVMVIVGAATALFKR